MALSSPRRWIIAAVGVLLLGVLSAGQSRASQPLKISSEVLSDDIVSCNGGAQEQVLVQINNAPTPVVENGAWAPLPGMQVNFNVPNGDSDHFLIQVSSETILDNQDAGYNWPGDHVAIQILIDGAVVVTDHILTTDAGQSNALQTCKRLGAGAHVVTVEWMAVDLLGNAMLTGEIDNTVLHVQRSD
ncbi:hypothetical protein AB0M36_08060 [Actinoplanes sp. NPDC051346]|uniref:hypothetical protein n=1 Tax=Actinoplanes sp. NPDC051346 TaxID=3155048 RepID=UPI00341F74C3